MAGRVVWSGRRLRGICSNHRWKFAAVLLMLLFVSGLSDHLFAKSFADFSWPPHIHLRAKVEEMVRARDQPIPNGLPNVWNRSIEIVPNCGKGNYKEAAKTQRLLVIVKSAVDNFEARNAIRNTWGSEKREGEWAMRFVFVLGTSLDRSISNRVMGEADEHHDTLLSADFVDEYYNNGKKFGLSLWLTTVSTLAVECPSAFTLLIDDDYMVNRENLVRLLSVRRGDEPLYEGWQMVSSPFRFRLHKHRISLAEYPFDAYPPYITAGAVLLSAHSAKRFYYGSLFLELFAFDDVYAGILAKQLSIQPQHNKAFTYWKARGPIDWSMIIAAHGFSPSEIMEQYPPTKPNF